MINKSYDFEYDPYIPTEENMFLKLKSNSEIDDSWTLHKIPFAHVINKKGVHYAQLLINSLNQDENKILVCQHIFADKLKVDKNTVLCSPHATINDKIISIPHYPVNVSIEEKERDLLFSFVGSVTTHMTRRNLVNLFPENCKDSGVHWALEKGLDSKIKDNYKNLLSRSVFSLCPRGTGISSVRIFESMASGAIPVIIANGYRPPLNNFINWKEISIFVKENEINNIKNILKSKSPSETKEMKEKMKDVYDNFLSIDNFHKSVEIEINGK